MPRTRLFAAVLLGTASLLTPAWAQAPDAKLAAIEAQIRALQGELARVKRELAAGRAEARAARPRPAPGRAPAATAQFGEGQVGGGQVGGGQVAAQSGATPASSVAPPAGPPGADKPGLVSFPSGRPTIASADGRASLTVGLQLHFDVGGYFAGDQPNAQPPRLNSFGQNLRRARIPFVFKYDDFEVDLTPDFGGSPDGAPTLYEASVNYAPKGTPLTATVGYFKPWLTLGDSTSSNSFLFLERPSIVEASRNIAAGDARASFGARWAAPRYFVAAYLTGAPYGSQQSSLAQPQQTGATLRLAGRPVAAGATDLHLGFSASDAFRIQRTASGQTLNVQDRPELRIDQNRLVSTGGLNARSAYSYGPEVAFRYKNFLVQGEYIRIGVDRTDGGGRLPTPGLDFSGGYVEASYVLTGEERRYNAKEAAFDNPKVARSLRDGGAGAFELVGRYSHIDLNDKVTRGVAATATGGVYGGEQTIYAVGLNWYPNDVLRFMLDYDIIQVSKLNAAGTTQTGRRVQAIALRAQAAF